jgi:sugar-specific transcriptional regulator TrmB
VPGAALDDSLVRLGLTLDESRAYHALLGHGPMGASDLTEATGISRGRIYEVVAGLLRKGVSTEIAGATRVFAPVDPSVSIDNLLAARREDLSELESAAEATVNALSRVVGGVGPSSPVELIRHRATVKQRFAKLETEAKEEILLLTKRPIYIPHGENPAELEAIGRGVRVRCLYESAMLTNPEERLEIESYIRAGEEARHSSELPAKLAIFDRRATLLLLEDPSDPDAMATVVVQHEGVAAVAVAAFEHLWDAAQPVPLNEDLKSTQRR